jgi:hypothetical protein
MDKLPAHTESIHGHLLAAPLLVSLSLFGLGLAPRSLAAEPVSSQPSPTQPNVPSLWWIREQFEAKDELIRKLIQSWTVAEGTDGKPGQVNYVVNRQMWTLLDYVERYTFLNDFGTAARDYGFNVVVSANGLKAPLGSYVCNYTALELAELNLAKTLKSIEIARTATTAVTPVFVSVSSPPCQILLDSGGKGSLRGRSNLFDADGAR